MEAQRLIDRMAKFPDALAAIVAIVTGDDARWRPDDGAWSILEIVNHLADEETDDFRARLESTLDDPAADWSPIDPEGVAVERAYQQRDLAESLARFAAARRESVMRLRARLADGPEFDAAHEHKVIGTLRAGDLLAAWADHDVLHLRQIARRLHQITGRDAGPYSTAYAGNW